MTIASTVNRMDYIGNGATSVYAYSFRILSEDDLLVTIRATDETETTLSLTTDYTLSGVGALSGGNLTLVNSSQSWLTSGNLKSGYVLTIRRSIDLTQDTDLRNQGDYYPEDVEDEFDRTVMRDQQLQDQLLRSIKLPETVSSDDFDCTLPTDIADNAGSAIVVNQAGTGFTFGSTPAGSDTSKVLKAGDTMTGDLTMNAQKATKYGDADSSNFITVKSPSVVPADYSVIWPSAAPTTSKFLKYDGTNFVWADPTGIVSAQSATYTITTTDGVSTVLVTTGSTNRTVNLPAAASSTNRVIRIKKVDSGTGKVTIDGNASETIDGDTTKDMVLQYEAMTLQCDGSNWHILDRQGIVTKWTSYTPTGSFSTNSTYTGYWRRNGDNIESVVSIAFAGAPNSVSATLNMPLSYTIDTSKIPGTSTEVSYGTVKATDVGTRGYVGGSVVPASTTVLSLYFLTADSTYGYQTTVQQNVPFTFGNTDLLVINYSVPCTQFAL